jgi:hypothetical protein
VRRRPNPLIRRLATAPGLLGVHPERLPVDSRELLQKEVKRSSTRYVFVEKEKLAFETLTARFPAASTVGERARRQQVLAQPRRCPSRATVPSIATRRTRP